MLRIASTKAKHTAKQRTALRNLPMRPSGFFADKSAHEQTDILARTDELFRNINEVIEKESPLVVALALLTAIRVHEQLVNKTSN